MKQKLNALLFILTLFTFNTVNGQVLHGALADSRITGAEEINTNSPTGIPSYIRFKAGSQIEFSRFESWCRTTFKLDVKYGFRLLSSDQDRIGFTHYRYQQTLDGLPIDGSMYLVHVKNNRIVSMNGLLFDNLNVPSGSRIGEETALKKALEYVPASLYRWQSEAFEKLLKEQSGDPKASWFPKAELIYAPVNNEIKKMDYRLTYRFDIYSVQPVRREYVYVDAFTGELVSLRNRIHTTDVPGVAHTKYSGIKNITTDSVAPGSYRLRETGRGLGIETYNLQTSTNSGNGIDFTDTDNDWNNINPQQDEVATDAHWGAEMTYDYFFIKHGRNSIDNNGQKLISNVHYDVDLINANWDGTHMNYGDGDLGQGYTPLTCLDVTGHEISHGLTQNTADLVYQNESGALNESFSDIFGNTIRQYGKQNPAINWFIGDEMGGTPFRNMADPNQFNDPDTYLGTDWYTGPGDNGGVHTNSGVQNFWYYLLVEGGTGTNDNGNNYTVTALGMDDAASIAFRNLTVYLTSSSDYADARYFSIQAAIDLFGPCTPQVIAVTNAWYAVGVGSAFSPGVTSDFNATQVSFCQAPATVYFTNASNNAGYFLWYFGDGDTSSAVNPVHTYNSLGTYTVKLVADGASCGIDSVQKPAYVSVDTLNPCIVIIPNSGQGQTQTACSGFLYDDGGPNGDYSDNTNSLITIAPTGASTVSLTFSVFDMENNFDYLYIYDGPSTAYPLIGQYSGNALPNGGVITSTTGSITLRQTTDQGLTFDGFALTWQCFYPTTAPTVNFTADVTTSCTGLINFSDLSTNGPLTWNWDFGDGNTAAIQNPTHTYQNNGTYTVRLTASNAIGADSLIKTSYITINKPQAPVSQNVTICEGETVTLNATGNDTLSWFNVATGGTPLATGTAFPTPALTTTTTYYVEGAVYQPLQYNGPVDNTFGGGNNYTNNTYRNLTFDVFSQVRLTSVKVFATGAGNRTIDLRDNTGTIINTATINIPDGTSRITLNFDLLPGNDYELGINGNSNLFRNNSGASFPYTLSGLISITGTNAGSPGYYYFFYDWELQEPPCISPRTAVTVTVDPAPVASFTSSANNATVTFTDGSTGASSWTWYFGDGNSSTQQNPVHTYGNSGNYNVMLVAYNGNCTDTAYQTITVIANIPDITGEAAVNVYPNPFHDQLTIQFADPSRWANKDLLLFNMLGENVLVKPVISPDINNSIRLDLSMLAPGVYTLQLQSEDATLYRKILKQ